MTRSPILLVDDDEALLDTLAQALEPLPVEIETAAGGVEALARLRNRNFAVVVTDVVMKDKDGFAVLEEAVDRYSIGRVVMLTGHGSREVAVEAMQKGASYYIEKPVDLAELRTKVQKCLTEHDKDLTFEDMRAQLDRSYGLEGIIGRDEKIVRILDVLRQIAPTNASVLILGESGTGKELVARALHNYSPRRAKPFVALNCGGLSEGTIESELFGHVKGAFTGAASDREGKIEYADQGTLFLDEVGEMPMSTQVKLLRVVEDREVARLGSNRGRVIDVRLLAATNADLVKKVESGEFPLRPLLPAQGRDHRVAAAARAARRHQAAGRSLPAPVRHSPWQGRRVDRPRRDGRVSAVRLARQRPRAAQRDREHGGAGARQHPDPPGPAA